MEIKSGLELGLNNCSNAEYHGDAKFFSSSGLKKLLENPAIFYKECILRERKVEEENPNFTEGSLLHSLVLEPDQVQADYAFFTGMRKQGPEFEQFKEQNKGKIIIGKGQKIRCDAYYQSYLRNPAAVGLIRGGFPEFSIAQVIKDMPLKMRADYINLDEGYMVDVKTTSDRASLDSFKLTIDRYKYELSAALYSLIAEQYYGRDFEFYWIVVDKKEADCQVFRMSKETRHRGLDMVSRAIAKYHECIKSGNWTDSTKLDRIEVERNFEILEA